MTLRYTFVSARTSRLALIRLLRLNQRVRHFSTILSWCADSGFTFLLATISPPSCGTVAVSTPLAKSFSNEIARGKLYTRAVISWQPPLCLRSYPPKGFMDAWVNDNGIRLRGLGQFQAASPKGTLDTPQCSKCAWKFPLPLRE